jgi:hypothetical protein
VEVEAAKVVPYRGLYSELSSCDMRCTPAVEEEDYEVMYSINGIHKTFNIQCAEPLVFLTSLWSRPKTLQPTSHPSLPILGSTLFEPILLIVTLTN